jgi:DNA-binding transcriptional LysR family regulator
MNFIHDPPGVHSDGRIGGRLKLRSLHILQAVVQAGSMAKAAAILGRTQSAISKSIAEMERTLGVTLLERASTGVAPTAYARILLKRGGAIFDELRQGLREIESLADPASGEVRVGCTEPMTSIVADVIRRLSRQFPRMVFHVSVNETTTLFHELRERELDLAVTRMMKDGTETDLKAQVLFHDPLAVVAGKRNPWLRRRNVELVDLLDEPWVLPTRDSFLARFIVEAFGMRGLDLPRSPVITASVQMRTSLLATGRFLTVLPSAMLGFAAFRGSLAALPIDLPETRRPVGIVTLRNRDVSSTAKLFIDCARTLSQVASGR